MKKYFYLALVVLFLTFPLVVQARCETCGAVETVAIDEDETTIESPRYKMEVQTREQTNNQGEDTNLLILQQTNTESQRDEAGQMNMGEVANQVEQLLQNRGEDMGIGEQVRQVAQQQVQVQARVDQALDQLQTRSRQWSRWLVGTDHQAVQALENQASQLDQLITQLEATKAETEDEVVLSALDDAIQGLEDQQVSLETRIQAENQRPSLFGWLWRIFK